MEGTRVVVEDAGACLSAASNSSLGMGDCSADSLQGYYGNPVVDYVMNFEWKTGETPLTSWEFLLAVHIVYAIAITLLESWSERNKDRVIPAWVKPYSMVHNLMMSALSLAMLVGIVVGAYQTNRFTSFETFACVRSNGGVQPGLLHFSMYAFYLSKMLEFIDTVLLVLAKKKLIWLHKIHHLTTMSLAWNCMVSNLGYEVAAAGLNCFVHVIMYFYFAIPLRQIRSSITTTQIFQFLCVLFCGSYAFYRRAGGVGMGGEVGTCQGTIFAEVQGFTMYFVFLVLFMNFFIRQYLAPPRKKAAPSTASPPRSSSFSSSPACPGQ